MKNEFLIPDSIISIDAISEMKELSKGCWFFIRDDLILNILKTDGAYMEKHSGQGTIRWVSTGRYPGGEFRFRNVDYWWVVSKIVTPEFTYEIPQYPKTMIFLKRSSKNIPWQNGKLLDAKLI